MSLASAMTEDETKEQDGDETPDAPLTTEKIMHLIKDLWSDDDEDVIKATLAEIANIGWRDASSDYEDEDKMRVLGVHITVFQVLQKYTGCLDIQEEGMRALANVAMLLPTKKLLGDIGCVEFILSRMEKYPDSEDVQQFGCTAIGNFVDGAKYNAERVEKSGGIAVVIAAMKAHPNTEDSEELQKGGCIALENMSEWEEYRPLIVKAGGASALSSIMETSDYSQQLREYAYDTMKILVEKSPR
jgi:hypothetical protein